MRLAFDAFDGAFVPQETGHGRVDCGVGPSPVLCEFPFDAGVHVVGCLLPRPAVAGNALALTVRQFYPLTVTEGLCGAPGARPAGSFTAAAFHAVRLPAAPQLGVQSSKILRTTLPMTRLPSGAVKRRCSPGSGFK